MPTPAYTTLASYLKPGFPQSADSESSQGATYVYIGPSSTISSNRPSIGDTWADGRPVVSVNSFELSTASGQSELTVQTGVNVSYSATIGTPAVEQTFYALRWRPVQKPLEVHPDFQDDGDYPLDATDRKCILGWRAEQDPELKSQFKFRKLDSNGTPGDVIDITTAAPNAHAFLKLVQLGVEEFTDYLPIWRKRSVYRGSTTPPVSSIGMKEVPSGSPPAGYEWVKSADDAERIGTTSKWRRDEEWEGAIKVYASAIGVYPPA